MSGSLIKEMSSFLEDLGCPFSIETGKKHRKIKVAGHLVGVIPLNCRGDQSEGGRRALLNIKSQARKVAREVSGAIA